MGYSRSGAGGGGEWRWEEISQTQVVTAQVSVHLVLVVDCHQASLLLSSDQHYHSGLGLYFYLSLDALDQHGLSCHVLGLDRSAMDVGMAGAGVDGDLVHLLSIDGTWWDMRGSALGGHVYQGDLLLWAFDVMWPYSWQG